MTIAQNHYCFIIDGGDNVHCAHTSLRPDYQHERTQVEMDAYEPGRNLFQVIPHIEHTDTSISEELGCVVFGIKQGNKETNRKAVLWHCVLDETQFKFNH